MKKLMNCLNFALLLAFMAFSVNLFAQPANDECLNAIDISAAFTGTCGDANLAGPFDNTGATGNATDPPEPGDDVACPGQGVNNLFGDLATVYETSIWFSFVVPDLNGDGSPVSYSLWTSVGEYGDCGLNPNNILGLDSAPDIGDTQVAIYEGPNCPDNTLGVCDYFAANEDLFNVPPWISGWLSLDFTPGVTYYMAVDSWDAAEGEFCLAVVPCGTVCGDGECAPVETYCDCSAECACDFANFGYVRYDPPTDGYLFTNDPTDIVVQCADAFGIAGSDNIYLSVGATDFTDCAGNTSDITVTYDNGVLFDGPGGTAFPSPATVPVGSLFFFELTPADVAVGSITVNACVDDGLGGQCCQDFVFDFAVIPNIAAPYCPCVAGSITDPAVVSQNVCFDSTANLCTDGNEDLTLPCPAGFTYQYAWRVLGDVYGTKTVLTNWVVASSACELLDVNPLFIDVFGYAPPNFTPGDPLVPGTYCVQGAALCVDAAGNVDSGCISGDIIDVILFPAGDPACVPVGVPGCTDPAFCEYDSNATTDDGSCVTSNADPGTCDDGVCTNGVETWDMATCTCLAGTPPTDLGCTDATFCEYDPAATCDDGSCVTSNADPGTCDDGDCTNGVETWDMATCACLAGTPPTDLGCTDATFCEYDPAATCDDGSCVTSNADPGTCDDGDCTNGLETWDATTCACVNNPPSGITGCTDPAFCEYDPNADCDDLSCTTPNADPGNCDDGDCTNGLESWDMATCTCVTTPPTGINGCTDPAFCEYDPNADCDDLSCTTPLPTAANIVGGPFTFCVGDGTPDFVSGITINGGLGATGAWVITDDALNILGLPGMPGDVDFDGAGFGNCLIWYVYFEDITGAEVGMNAGNLGGCFALSNSIEVVREDCMVTGGIDGDITDPCFCGNPLNIPVTAGGDPTDPTVPVAYFYETVTLSTTPPTTGLAITATETGIVDATGNSTTITWIDNGDGTYTANFYHVDAVGFSLSNIVSSDGVVNFPDISGSCTGCETCNGGDIGGSISTSDSACDVSGISVVVMDAAGNMTGMAITDAAGNWSLAGGPFPCGDYIAALDAASVPACYTDAGGEVGPVGFTVGDGGVYGYDFNSFNEVPTLSQWGLMSLALLLMIFGAVKLATVNNTQLNRKKA